LFLEAFGLEGSVDLESFLELQFLYELVGESLLEAESRGIIEILVYSK
jgi:hypothetical protein